MRFPIPLGLLFLCAAASARAFDSAVVFNEVHYHPADEVAQTEWIELKSNQGVDIDISGWTLTGGVNYTFPANTIIPGNGLVVIAKTPGQISGALGPFTGVLSNNSETLRLRHRGGRIIDELSYEDAGGWPLAADGVGFTLARRDSEAARPGPSAWSPSTSPGGTPGTPNFGTNPVAITAPLVEGGTAWKYRDDVAAPPAEWNTASYNDTAWLSGPAALGNPGSPTVRTLLAAGAPVSYLRKSFTFTGNPAQTTLRLNPTLADGAVFYLNGTELTRVNLPAGPVDHATTASSVVAPPVAGGFATLPATALVHGVNVLAVSLHKGTGSSNCYFDAVLEAAESIDAVSSLLVFNEIASALDPAFFIEFKNVSPAAVSTAGWRILTSTGQSLGLPAATIPAGGLVSFTAAELGLFPADGLRLTLTSTNGLVHRDSRSITNSLRGLTSAGDWGRPDAPTPGTGNVTTVSSAMVINEIFYKGMNGSPEQWIELHNRSAAPVDLSGWSFSEGVSYLFPAATILPAGGFAVVAWDPAAFAALHPGVTAFGPFSGSLSGRGETLTLSDANGNTANTVRYGDGGLWSQWADGGGSSLELRDPAADNTNPAAWDASDESTQTAWQTVSYSGAPVLNPANDPTLWNEFIFGMLSTGEVLIDDVSVTTGSTPLIQNGSFATNANTWRIIGNHSGSVVPDPFSPSNNVLKLAASAGTDPMHNQACTTLKSGTAFHTLNASATYNVSFRAKWLRGSNRLHSRFYANRLPVQTVLNIPATGGTPGTVNGSLVANLGPTLTAFRHAPVVPAVNAGATVTVAAADPHGIASVELFTSVNGAAFTSTAMTGADGTWTAPIAGRTAGSIVQFYVRATDSLGAVSFLPPEGAASRALIQWADGRAITRLGTGAKPHNLRIITTAADATAMYRQENLMSNADIPCTIVWNESVVYYRAGVSLKSSEHGRYNINRVGYNLSFPSDDLFLGVHSGVAVDRSGGTTTGQKEILLKTLTSLAGGIAAPEDDIIRLIPARAPSAAGIAFDGSAMLGPAILSKTRLKDDYLDGQWENGADGMMFKYERIYILSQTINPVTRVVDSPVVPENPKVPQDGAPSPPGVNVVSLGANKELYRWHWLVENGRDADDFTGLINVLTAIGQTGGTAAFNTQTAQYLDISPWLRATIPAALYGSQDNYLGKSNSQHNVLFYFPPGGKAQLLPWDLDYLDQSNPNATLTNAADLSKFLANPIYKRLFWGHMQDILKRSFNTATMTRWAAHYSKFSIDDMTGSVSAYLTPRAAYAQTQINAAVPSTTFNITNPADNTTLNAASATLTGVGWVDVDEIRLAGSTEPLNVTWTTDRAFTLTLPLAAGTRTYTLKAYNPQGIEVGSVTRTYTNTSTIIPAVAGTLAVTELNYNPSSANDLEEFIELTNLTSSMLELGNCHFDETTQGGIAYTFPPGTQLAAGGRLLVLRDRPTYQAAYGNLANTAPNQWAATSALSNSGETLTLFAADGTLILNFAYSDNLKAADGGGSTMVRILAPTNPDPNTYFWRASTTTGGNPGGSDALLLPGDPLADADGDGQPLWIEAALGTSDTVPSPPPTGVILSPGPTPGTFLINSQALPNADHVIATLESSPDLAVWTPLPSGSPVSGGKQSFRLRLTLR